MAMVRMTVQKIVKHIVRLVQGIIVQDWVTLI